MEPLMEMITNLNEEGWLISDLFQTGVGKWNAVLRRDGEFSTAYGVGDMPITALLHAMENRKPKTNWEKVKKEQNRQERVSLTDAPIKSSREPLVKSTRESL